MDSSGDVGPNITGKFDQIIMWQHGLSAEGAFSYDVNTPKKSYPDGSDHEVTIIFDASSANGIYGDSSTVQPPTLKLLPCIKA